MKKTTLLLAFFCLMTLVVCVQCRQPQAGSAANSADRTAAEDPHVSLINRIDQVRISSPREEFEFHKPEGSWMIKDLDYWLNVPQLESFLLRLHYIPVSQQLALDQESRVEAGLSETSPQAETTVISLYSQGQLERKYILGGYQDPEKGKLKENAMAYGKNATAWRFVHRSCPGTDEETSFLTRDNMSDYVQSMAGWIHPGLWPHPKRVSSIEIKSGRKTLCKLHRTRLTKPFSNPETGKPYGFHITELANQLFLPGGIGNVFDVLSPQEGKSKSGAAPPCKELIITEFYGYRYHIRVLDENLDYQHGLITERSYGLLGVVESKDIPARYTWALFDGSHEKAAQHPKFAPPLSPEQFSEIQRRVSSRVYLINAGTFDALYQALADENAQS